jgi:D-inositol-3-phosphate glycosyltransferase
VHTAHTLAKVKNAALADGDAPEPRSRVIGEEQVVAETDRLVGNTDAECAQLVRLYDADPTRTVTIPPGVDLCQFTPGDRRDARAALGLAPDAVVLTFVGRIQPLKAPDVLIRAVGALREREPALADQLTVVICGGPSGSGLDRPTALIELAGALGVADRVRFLPPQTGDDLPALYRAADLVAVPSYNESFGLVALEAQACGTPVLAAAVGGLVTAVRDGVSGVLIDGHDPVDWARTLARLLPDRPRRDSLARGAQRHARNFSWHRTVSGLLAVYGEAIDEHRARLAGQLSGDPALSCSW